MTEINIFPIKSCKGFTVTSGATTPRGFTWDRQWMVVKDDGKFLTQRQIPKMSQIAPEIVAHDPNSERVEMRLTAPGMPPLTIESTAIGPIRHATVWNDTCDAIDEGEAVAQWLSKYLETPCNLVRFGSQFVRHVDSQYKKTDNDQVGFADGYPFLLISEPSLDELNEKLEENMEERLPMNRFRPNIVVKGCAAFDEDEWKTVEIGDIVFHVVKPCSRCVITCTDQDTSKVGVEPLRTLSTFRNSMNKILFGQNLVPDGNGVLRVGDTVKVVS